MTDTKNDDVENDYDNPFSRVSEAAQAAGREQAVKAIFEEGLARARARPARGVQGTEAIWKAHGAFQIWHAAYAAAYREMLAIEDQLDQTCTRGAFQIAECADDMEC
jgi:hypothetical protein